MNNLNPELGNPIASRVPIVLLIDLSESMKKEFCNSQTTTKTKIEQVNHWMRVNSQNQNTRSDIKIDLAVVTFSGSVTLEQQFIPIDQWSQSILSAHMSSSVDEAIMYAMQLAEGRQEKYHHSGIPSHPSQLFLFSDGKSINTELGAEAHDALSVGLKDGHIGSFVCIGVTGSKLNKLEKLIEFNSEGFGETQAVRIENFQIKDGINYRDWSRSISAVPVCFDCGVDLPEYDTVEVNFCPNCGAEVASELDSNIKIDNN